MSYDMKNVRRYSFLHDFGAGGDIYAVKGPKGKKGKLINYGVDGVTETFTNVTTGALISVGTVADADAYGNEIDLGALAADSASNLRSLYDPIADATTWATYMLEDDLPADTVVALHCVAPTGGTPAGIGTAFMEIQWDD